MTTELVSAEHVSPACVKLNFSYAMQCNGSFVWELYYVAPDGIPILYALPPHTQNQVSSTVGHGGAPTSIYLILESVLYNAAPVSVGLTPSGFGVIIDHNGDVLDGSRTVSLTTTQQQTIGYWESSGRRVADAFTEFSKLGRAKFGSGQPFNYSTAHMIGKLNDIIAGGTTGKLAADIPGPSDPEYVTPFNPAGFANPVTSLPGIGSTISFAEGHAPYHVDKLWGACNGSNTVFRTNIPYHPFACVVIATKTVEQYAHAGVMDPTNWFAPNSGDDRLLTLIEPPPSGVTLLAVYLPKKSLLKIGNEIIAYEDNTLDTGQATIYGRAQLMSRLEEHSARDTVEDVWATSFVRKSELNTLAFGASGRALEYIAQDEGCPRSDNLAMTDTQLRRYIFNTAVTMRGVFSTVYSAIRFIYPHIWRYIILDEDPRWPGCLTIWVSESESIGDTAYLDSPLVEPWETWLDHNAWLDGFTGELLGETYYRDDVVDEGYYGDYFLDDFMEDPEGWPYPVVLAGNPAYRLGTPASFIPPPFLSGSTIDTTYRTLLSRPAPLDKILPIGCGVLLLDYDLL